MLQPIKMEVSKVANIRNRYNQVPHLTQIQKVEILKMASKMAVS